MIGTMKLILGAGFRVFFLSAAVFAVVVLALWEAWLALEMAGGAPAWLLPVESPAYMWHARELIYGYGTAAIAGFLLTAVPNWTGTRAAGFPFVAVAAFVWLAGRLAVGFSPLLPAGLVALADLAFLPLVAGKILTQLVRRPKPQNVMFVLFLAILWAGNLLVHLQWLGLSADTADLGLRVGLLALAIMIGVIGGRVIPAFTRNAMRREGVEEGLPVSRPWADRAGLALTLALPAVLALSEPLAGVLAIAAGVVEFARMSGWRSAWTLRQPILWALHLPFVFLAAGLVALGLAWLGLGSEAGAIHLLGIGAVGGMTAAVMGRAILGHTGRALVAPAPLTGTFALIPLAAVLRWAGSEVGSGWYWPLVLGSGALWILAFVLFVVALWPAISQPRLHKE